MTQILQWERVYFFKSGRIRIVKFKIAWSNQAVKFENSLLKIELCIKLFFPSNCHSASSQAGA